MKNILVYRDRLIPRSEREFMRRQYMAFGRLKPHWVGCRLDGSPAITRIEPLILGGTGPFGAAWRVLFKQFGIVPPAPDLAALRPRLIHAQFGRGGALALPLARTFGIPLAVTFHGGDAFKEKHFRKNLPPTIFQRRWPDLIAYASLFICVSEGVRDKLAERGVPGQKLAVIPIGADCVTPPAGTGPSPYFLFAGRFVEKKGIFILLDAIRRLRASGCALPFVLAGDGPLLAGARARAAGLADVEFAGWLSPAELGPRIAAACAVIVPSIAGSDGDAEGLPSVAMEALAASVPVIASEQTGLTGILAESGAGLTIPPGDAAALAEAIRRAAADPGKRRDMAEAAYRLALRRFEARHQSRLLEDRLLSLLPPGDD